MSSDRSASTGSYWSGYDLLWGLRDAEPTRRTAIDRAQIIASAIAIADEKGLAAVSMRNVATALGSAAMSLYRHVPDKDALVSMMVDAAIAESQLEYKDLPAPEGWRDALRLVAESTWQVCQRHRWFSEASLVRPPITPSGIAGFEHGLAIFDAYDLDIGTKAHFVGVVYSTVVGAALHTAIEQDARSRVEMTEEQVYAAGAPFIERVVASGEFPRVSAFIYLAEHLEPADQMRAGVELILDGIAVRLAALKGATDLSDDDHAAPPKA